MSTGIAAWLQNPVTLALVGLGALLLFATIEVLLRNLAEIGNVRFQGLIDDHPNLFSFARDGSLNLSSVLDTLRWLQIPSLACTWLIILIFPYDFTYNVNSSSDSLLCLFCLLLPLIVVVLVRLVPGRIGERGVVMLLRIVRPLAWPLLLLIVKADSPKPLPAANEAEEEEASEREIQALLDVGQAAGIFEVEESEFVESLVDFFDTTVREVMTPRTAMIALAETATSDELLTIFSESRKSRIPIYRETVDHVIGVVHVKNLVKHFTAEQRPPISSIVHECIVVPEAKRLGEMLRDFQRHRQQMAIVVDEYGGTSGIVTLEDILEEIVGEIEDEHDRTEPPEVQELTEGVYRLQGRADVDVLEDLFQIKVDEEDVDTIGGLVFARHGTVPEPGTEVSDDPRGLLFTVEEMDGRRIGSVTVCRTTAKKEPGNDS